MQSEQLPTAAIKAKDTEAILEDRKKRKAKLRIINDADASVPSEGPVSEILYYHTDHLGSVRVITLSDGTVWKRSDYLPFGEVAFESIDTTSLRSQALNGYGYTHPKASYTGQEKDLNTGLYYYGARFYDAEVGRFILADVLKNPAGSQVMNSYGYANNNPILNIDPTGHWAEDSDFSNRMRWGFIGAGIGAAVGSIGGFIYGYQHHHTGSQMWRDIGYGALIGAGAGFTTGAIAGPYIGLSFARFGAGDVPGGPMGGDIEYGSVNDVSSNAPGTGWGMVPYPESDENVREWSSLGGAPAAAGASSNSKPRYSNSSIEARTKLWVLDPFLWPQLEPYAKRELRHATLSEWASCSWGELLAGGAQLGLDCSKCIPGAIADYRSIAPSATSTGPGAPFMLPILVIPAVAKNPDCGSCAVGAGSMGWSIGGCIDLHYVTVTGWRVAPEMRSRP